MRASAASAIVAANAARVCGRQSASIASCTRATSSASRPARSMSPLSTSSSGSTPPTSGSSSSVMLTPSSSRSRPACHVFVARRSSWYGARWAASRPQRTPDSSTHSSIRARSSSSSRKRRRTGSRPAKSTSSDALTRVAARSHERGDGGQDRVRLAQGAVGEPDPQPAGVSRARRRRRHRPRTRRAPAGRTSRRRGTSR